MQSQPPSAEDAHFTQGLLNPSEPTPPGVVGPQGKGAVKRYDVYRNNVTVSLINAMADIYPAIQRIVGEEFFRALAREYVRTYPPTSPLLFLYGEYFAEFLRHFEHVKHLHYLADVARLERAWLTAYHAADAAPLDPAGLSAVPPQQTGMLRFSPKPGTAIIASAHPVFTIHAMNRDMIPLGPVDLNQAENALVTRPDADVLVTPITRPETIFFGALLNEKKTLEAAASEALAQDPQFDINEGLAKLFGTAAAQSATIDVPTPPSPTDATMKGSSHDDNR